MDRREQRRLGTARLIPLREDRGQFDREFWRTIPAAERLALVWDMTLEALEWRNPRGDQPRLQRSVCRIERLGR